jgi:hypothetical protein
MRFGKLFFCIMQRPLTHFTLLSRKLQLCFQQAGLLTYSNFGCLPISLKNSGGEFPKSKKELTAAGTVRDLHPIPF